MTITNLHIWLQRTFRRKKKAPKLLKGGYISPELFKKLEADNGCCYSRIITKGDSSINPDFALTLNETDWEALADHIKMKKGMEEMAKRSMPQKES